MQEERAIVRAVRGLILQLCDYIKIRDENLVDEIIQKLRELTSNEAALKLLIKEKSLGTDLFEKIKDYIKSRHMSIEDFLKHELQERRAPSAIVRFLYEAIKRGRNPFSFKVTILGISLDAMKKGFTRIVFMKKPRVLKATKKESKELLSNLRAIIDKRKKIENAKNLMINELTNAYKAPKISEIIALNRPRTYQERYIRLIALIELINSDIVKLSRKKTDIIIKKQDPGSIQ